MMNISNCEKIQLIKRKELYSIRFGKKAKSGVDSIRFGKKAKSGVEDEESEIFETVLSTTSETEKQINEMINQMNRVFRNQRMIRGITNSVFLGVSDSWNPIYSRVCANKLNKAMFMFNVSIPDIMEAIKWFVKKELSADVAGIVISYYGTIRRYHTYL